MRRESCRGIRKRMPIGSLLGLLLLFFLGTAGKGLVAGAGVSQVSEGGAASDFDPKQALEKLRKQIADVKTKPAEEVFKNIQLHKGMPAGRLLSVMEIGYSKSLGVDCTHCHVVDQWEKDEKPTKQIAREMAGMARAINNDFLKKIKGLKGENPVVNCTTCHRGQIKPALNLP